MLFFDAYYRIAQGLLLSIKAGKSNENNAWQEMASYIFKKEIFKANEKERNGVNCKSYPQFIQMQSSSSGRAEIKKLC